MAKKKRRASKRGRYSKKIGRRGVRRGEKVPKAASRAGAKAKKLKVHSYIVPKNQDVWNVQTALRRDKYFARVVGPNRVATNAPI